MVGFNSIRGSKRVNDLRWWRLSRSGSILTSCGRDLLIHGVTVSSSPSADQSKINGAIQIAMARLKDEFQNILITLTIKSNNNLLLESVDSSSLSESSSSSHQFRFRNNFSYEDYQEDENSKGGVEDLNDSAPRQECVGCVES